MIISHSDDTISEWFRFLLILEKLSNEEKIIVPTLPHVITKIFSNSVRVFNKEFF